VTREPVSTHQADLTDPASLTALRGEVLAAHGKVDVVINAAGYDARKPLAEHSLDDFRRTLEVNLLGAMLVTQTFLAVMADGVILHLGGFADGRLAFPFHSADAAARAGLRAFAESVNRELALRPHPRPVVSFFSPSPADTEAERPFHPLWRQMGTAIVPVEKVGGGSRRPAQKSPDHGRLADALLRRAECRLSWPGRRADDETLRSSDGPVFPASRAEKCLT
jgi:NAD(P)-dependent dehydrogenase (short-subunit alcohol dehydrogenase family)